MTNEEKLKKSSELAISYILLFLKDYISSEELSIVEKMLKTCPIVAETLDVERNEFGKETIVGGIAEQDRIVINQKDIESIDILNKDELNNLLGTIIHEYAHKIRAIKNSKGGMLEEAFASIFAEVCINNARIKSIKDIRYEKTFAMLTSYKYQHYESQVKAFLYILSKHNLDIKVIAEYIAGNQEKFKQICVNIFGENFINFYNSITSFDNNNSEHIITELITKYIKQNGLSISEYNNPKNRLLMFGNLYSKSSPTLNHAIVSSGIESFEEKDKSSFELAKSSNKFINKINDSIDSAKQNRIQKYIETNYSLTGKSIEEIYDTIIELCSTYVQHKTRNDEESKLFINEITKLIPNIEDFKNKFIALRVAGLDKNIFDNINLDNVTFNDIFTNMKNLLQENTNETIIQR